MANTMQLAMLKGGVIDEGAVVRYQIRKKLKEDLTETYAYLDQQRKKLKTLTRKSEDKDRILYRALIAQGEETVRTLKRTIRELAP
jgi:bacterioferritin (cytochrome b1)